MRLRVRPRSFCSIRVYNGPLAIESPIALLGAGVAETEIVVATGAAITARAERRHPTDYRLALRPRAICINIQV